MIRALKDWWGSRLQRRFLLVCAGSGRGRVPYAMVTRKSANNPIQDDRSVFVTSKSNGGRTWSFHILVGDEEKARTLANALKKEEVYSLSPDDFGVRTILFRRDDWGAEPRWIGGDISAAGVDPQRYSLSGNHVYFRR